MIVASRARSKLSLARRKVPAENYRSENRNYRNKYSRSSVLPAQKPQILRKFLRICQLFNILWQRPQDQRPISLVFIWQLMDQIIRFFRIYSHVKHILHSTDTNLSAKTIFMKKLSWDGKTFAHCSRQTERKDMVANTRTWIDYYCYILYIVINTG